MLGPEPLDPAQHEPDLQPPGGEDAGERLGGEPSLHPIALTEVHTQLHQAAVHSPPPIRVPAQARSSPANRLSRRLTTAGAASPSSASRCDSNIQVLKVVYAPISPVPNSRSADPDSAAPVRIPRTNAPERLTASVPSGSPDRVRADTQPSRIRRSTAPEPPSNATPA